MSNLPLDPDALFPNGPPAWPRRDEQVRAAILAAWEDGSWGRYLGPHVERLQTMLSEMHGMEHVLLCSSGTVAVELALRGVKVAPGDEVVLAAYDFAGNFRAIEAIGARPVLADLASGTWTLDPNSVEAAMGKSVKAIVASHLHSSLAPMSALREIADRHGVALIEDACQAHGAVVEGRIAGAWGDVAVLSFGGSKLLTSGRGGAVLTRRAEVMQRIKIFCDRGNHAFPLSELQAATLRPQLTKLAECNDRRRRSVAVLRESCRDLPFLIPPPHPHDHSQPSYYKWSWFFDEANCDGASREQFVATAQRQGLAIDAGFRGFGLRTSSRCRKAGPLTNADRTAAQTVVLHHPILLEPPEIIVRVAEALRASAKKCGWTTE